MCRLRHLLTALVAVVAVPLWSATAAAQLCPSSTQAPQVSFTVDSGTVAYSRQLSRRSLNALRRQRGKGASLSGAAVGLTLADLAMSMQTRVETRPAGQGRLCVYLSTVEAAIGYGQIRVFVARDYRPDSCPDKVILAHENRHVAVFRETLARYGPNMRQTLEATARQQGPLLVGPGADPAAVFQARISQAVDPLFKQMQRDMELANEAIDSPTSYAAEQARCQDW